MKRSVEDELAFSQKLIEADRSNFSAWHYRSVLLPQVHAARGHLTVQQLQDSDAQTKAGLAQQTDGESCDVAQPGNIASGKIPLYELQAEFDFLYQVQRCQHALALPD